MFFFVLIQFNWTIDFSISFSLSFCSRSRGLHLLGIVHIVPFSFWFDLPPLCLLFVPLPSFSKRLLCLGNFFFFFNLQNYIWALILPWNWIAGHLNFLMSYYQIIMNYGWVGLWWDFALEVIGIPRTSSWGEVFMVDVVGIATERGVECSALSEY